MNVLKVFKKFGALKASAFVVLILGTGQAMAGSFLQNVTLAASGANSGNQMSYIRLESTAKSGCAQNVVWFRPGSPKEGYATALMALATGRNVSYLAYTISPDTNCYVDQIETAKN